MSENQAAKTVHSLIHGAQPAICSTDWSEMTGDDCMRTCPQCGAVALHVDRMEPEKFCAEAEKLRLKQGLVMYRRADGTYTFSDRNCSPKVLLAPLKSDLRAVSIIGWWADRHMKYNECLFNYGVWVGGGASVIMGVMCLFNTGNNVWTIVITEGTIIVGFVVVAIVCALAANILFALSLVLNLAIPGFLGPARKYAGPALVTTSMVAIGSFMTLPLIYVLMAIVVWLAHR